MLASGHKCSTIEERVVRERHASQWNNPPTLLLETLFSPSNFLLSLRVSLRQRGQRLFYVGILLNV